MHNNGEHNYLQLVKDIILYGKKKTPSRVREGVEIQPTVGLANRTVFHDMSLGFPLLTTKKMGIYNIAVELEGFIRGITDKKWYQERKCHIWDEWHNPKSDNENDLGPIYGYQWRHFDQHYGTFNGINGVTTGTDQFQSILDTLKNKPSDRRMVCSAWNPNQIEFMALPPCHYAWGVTVYDDKLHLQWNQRSCDVMLGLPYNLASYALLLLLLSSYAKMQPGTIMGTILDAHIYESHIEGAREQITRDIKECPIISLWRNIPDWTYGDLSLLGYECHPPLKFDVVV